MFPNTSEPCSQRQLHIILPERINSKGARDPSPNVHHFTPLTQDTDVDLTESMASYKYLVNNTEYIISAKPYQPDILPNRE